MRYVEILWDDAHDAHAGEWVGKDSAEVGMAVTTVGILIKKTRGFFVVSHTQTEDGAVRGTFNIPITGVRSIRTLK